MSLRSELFFRSRQGIQRCAQYVMQTSSDWITSALARNILSLYVVRGLTYLLPLLILPYLLRKLGPRPYGAIVFAQSIIAYVVLFTDFGFSLSATRAISLARDDEAKLAKVFWTTMVAKIMLFAGASAVVVFLISIVPSFKIHSVLIYVCGLTVIGTVLLPQWYFQGLERMGVMAWLQAVSKLLGMLPIFFLVRSPKDELIGAALLSAPSMIGGVICLVAVRYIAPVAIYIPTFKDIREALCDSRHLFISNVATSAYVTGNALILGVVSGDTAVAVYSVANRAALASFSFFSPVIQATFPRASLLFGRDRWQARSFVRRVSVWLVSGSLFISCALFIFARNIVSLLGGSEFASAARVLQVMALLPTVVCVATILAQMIMVNVGLSRSLSRIYMLMAVMSFISMPILASLFGALGGAVALILVETLGPLAMAFVIVRSGRLSP